MPNLMEFLRLKNLFGQPDIGMGNDMPSQGGITGTPMFNPKQDPYGNINFGPTDVTTPVATPPTAPDEYNVGSRMGELYHPETQATERFNGLMDSYPKAEDYHPSMLRRIGAALVASGHSFDKHGWFTPNKEAMQEGMDFLNKPYNKKLGDWSNQVKPTQAAATLERNQNVNDRTLAYQTVSNELRQQSQDAKAANDTKNAEIREHRAQIYEYKATHPDIKFDFKGPNVMIADPKTGKVTDTGIPTGSMSELDKMNLQHENKMNEIDKTGEEQRNTENVKHSHRITEIGTRGMESRKTRETPGSSNSTNKPETPSQTRIRQFNTARELYNSNPTLRQFIKLGNPGSSDFTVTPPSEGYFGHSGPTKEQYQQIQDAIYSKAAPIPVVSHNTSKVIKQYSPSRNQTRISTDGGKTWKIIQGKQ